MATAHGWTGQSGRERRIYYPAHKRLLARFPGVVAVSTEIRDELVRLGAAPDRIAVILNGIDPDVFKRDDRRRDDIRASLGLSPSDIVIGAVGRLEQQKRFDLLLDALARLAPEHASLRLVVVGDGSLRGRLESHAADLGLAERCRFLGHCDDVSSLHHAFDVFAQSSEYEGTPNAVLEAMAMETPIVATAAGGTHELAAHGVHALIVPVGDVQALRWGIESVLADPPAARSRVSAARQRIERELSFEARTRRLEAIYADLYDKHGQKRPTRREASRPISQEAPHA
jgi:glycosyltransferase involved in cell wall biosynthesis